MEIFNQISKKASETYKVTAEKTSKIARETKLKMEINTYKSNVELVYKEIGKKIYEKYIEDKEIKLEDIQDELNKADTINEKIEKSKEEIMKLKDKIKCKKCSYEMDEDFEYCPKCGTKKDI